jgi:hypothetical protein
VEIDVCRLYRRNQLDVKAVFSATSEQNILPREHDICCGTAPSSSTRTHLVICCEFTAQREASRLQASSNRLINKQQQTEIKFLDQPRNSSDNSDRGSVNLESCSSFSSTYNLHIQNSAGSYSDALDRCLSDEASCTLDSRASSCSQAGHSSASKHKGQPGYGHRVIHKEVRSLVKQIELSMAANR